MVHVIQAMVRANKQGGYKNKNYCPPCLIINIIISFYFLRLRPATKTAANSKPKKFYLVIVKARKSRIFI